MCDSIRNLFIHPPSWGSRLDHWNRVTWTHHPLLPLKWAAKSAADITFDLGEKNIHGKKLHGKKKKTAFFYVWN